MALCRDLEAFKEILNMAVDYAMETKVADVAVSAIQGAVDTEVYRKYNPKMYVRDREMGGLQDKHNIERRYDPATKTLEVQDVRDDPDTKEWRWKKTGDPDNTVADVVEAGHPYHYHLRPYPGARPFHSVAEQRLIDHKWAEQALEADLKQNLDGWSY